MVFHPKTVWKNSALAGFDELGNSTEVISRGLRLMRMKLRGLGSGLPRINNETGKADGHFGCDCR